MFSHQPKYYTHCQNCLLPSAMLFVLDTGETRGFETSSLSYFHNSLIRKNSYFYYGPLPVWLVKNGCPLAISENNWKGCVLCWQHSSEGLCDTHRLPSGVWSELSPVLRLCSLYRLPAPASVSRGPLRPPRWGGGPVCVDGDPSSLGAKAFSGRTYRTAFLIPPHSCFSLQDWYYFKYLFIISTFDYLKT